MKNDTTLCACAVVMTLETQKCRKSAPHSFEFNFFINCIDTNGFRRMREEGQIYKTLTLPQIFYFFAKGLSYGLSKFSDNFTPFFRL